MYLKGGTRDHFMGFLAREYPHMVDGYHRLYAGAYAKSDYVRQVRAMIGVLQDRYEVGRRTRPAREGAETGPRAEAVVEQPVLEWGD